MNRRDDTDDTAARFSHGETGLGPDIWMRVRNDLGRKIAPDEYAKWIRDLKFIAEVHGSILIAARDRLSYDRVDGDYRRLIEQAWKTFDPKQRPLRLECWSNAPQDVRSLVSDPWAGTIATPRKRSVSNMTFGTLVVGPSNDVAVMLGKRIAGGEATSAPVALLYGPQGVGKTHILRAIETDARSQLPDTSIIYMTAEEFMARYHAGVKKRDTSELKNSLRSAELVLIDDLQWIAGKPGTDTEFFANIRAVSANGGKVVLTADAAPGELKGFSRQMQSELKGAAAVEIGLPDQNMRREIVRVHAALVKLSDPNFSLTDEMLERIVRRVRGPGRNLCGTLWSLHTETGFGKHAPTMEMLDRVIIRQEGITQPPTINAIKRATMQEFSLTKAELESPCKEQAIVYPRQIAMYLCRKLTAKSFPQIGRCFGKRDHTTVLYAVRKIERLLPMDPDMANDVDRVVETLRDLQSEGKA